MSILHDLDSSRLGFLSHGDFKARYIHNRALTLEPNRDDYFERPEGNHKNPITSFHVSTNRIACAHYNNTIAIYDASSVYENSQRCPIPFVGQTISPNLSPSFLHSAQWRALDGEVFSSSGDGDLISVFFIEEMKLIDRIKVGCKQICHHVYNPHNYDIIGAVGPQGTLVVIDLRIGAPVNYLSGPFARMVDLSWCPFTSHKIITVSRDEVVGWDLRMNKTFASTVFPDYGLKKRIKPALKITPNGCKSIILGPHGYLLSFDNERLVYTVLVNEVGILPKRQRFIFDVSWDSYPQLLFMPGQQLKIYNLNSGVFVKDLIAHTHPVVMAIYNNLNHELYTIADNQEALLWEPPICKNR